MIVVGAVGWLLPMMQEPVNAFYLPIWSKMSEKRKAEWRAVGSTFWNHLAGGDQKC